MAMPNARIMMHQPMGGASGQAIDVEIQAKEIMYHKSNIARILSEITGRSAEQVEKDIDRDRYMSPVEAMEYGLIDAVIDSDAILPLQPSPERVKPRRNTLRPIRILASSSFPPSLTQRSFSFGSACPLHSLSSFLDLYSSM
ncbi:hypothetical protein CLOM_g2028 [Closterium sp. NIES-68]|nr:hypothetical protein CLOM_g2028 [Closterium sp. NIES-68]